MSPDDLVLTLHSGIQALGDLLKEQDRNIETLEHRLSRALLRLEEAGLEVDDLS